MTFWPRKSACFPSSRRNSSLFRQARQRPPHADRPDEGEMAIEDLIANEGVIITITHNSLIKRTNITSYRASAARTRRDRHDHARGRPAEDDDFVEHLFTASTHDYLMFFTNSGAFMWSACTKFRHGRASKGRSSQPARMKPGERVPRSSASNRKRSQGTTLPGSRAALSSSPRNTAR